MRYADDMMILCKSRKAAVRTLESIRPFIEDKLFLQLNEQKTKVIYFANKDLKFLGFGFWKKEKVGYRARPHQKSQKKCVDRLKELTQRSKGQSLDDFRRKLAWYVRGWVNYFKEADMTGFVRDTDAWLRRRIRQIYWKQWKKTKTKVLALIRLGIARGKAWEWANSRKAYWRISKSHVLQTSQKTEFLRSKGWLCLGDVYR